MRWHVQVDAYPPHSRQLRLHVCVCVYVCVCVCVCVCDIKGKRDLLMTSCPVAWADRVVDTQLDVASRERHARLFQIADLRYAVVNVTVNRFVGLFCHVSRSLLMATHTSSYANRKP